MNKELVYFKGTQQQKEETHFIALEEETSKSL